MTFFGKPETDEEYRERTKKIEEAILEELDRRAEPLSMTELIKALRPKNFTDSDIKLAFWNLKADGKAKFTDKYEIIKVNK